MDDDVSFGGWLQRRRKARGLTQAQLGQRIGCSASLIRKIEADERRPSTEVAALLADCLQLAVDDRTTFTSLRVGPWAPTASARRPTGRIPRSPAASRHGTLPVPPTPFIGRMPDRAALAALLTGTLGPLVTLVGPPGIGKTRLSVQVAATCAPSSPMVSFSFPSRRSAMRTWVLPVIAQALQVAQTGALPLLDRVRHWLIENTCCWCWITWSRSSRRRRWSVTARRRPRPQGPGHQSGTAAPLWRAGICRPTAGRPRPPRSRRLWRPWRRSNRYGCLCSGRRRTQFDFWIARKCGAGRRDLPAAGWPAARASNWRRRAARCCRRRHCCGSLVRAWTC